MKRKLSLPVRFTPEQESAISQIAEENGLSRAEVVRMAVAQFLSELNAKGEMIVEKVIHAPGPGAKRVR